jgi:hypothetical protein
MTHATLAPGAMVGLQVSVRHAADDLWTIALDGDLPVDWAALLATGLARASLSVVHAEARKRSNGSWCATLAVDPAGQPPTVPQVRGILTGRTTWNPTPLGRLDDFMVHWDAVREAASVEVRGPDHVGFLGGLLRMMAGLTLFPVELRIQTSMGQAHDIIWLKGLGGRPPTQPLVHALEQRLEDLRTRPSTP